MASEINPTKIRSSAFQTRLPQSNCSVLVKCEESKSSLVSPISNNSLRVPNASNCITSNNNNNNCNANSNSPKMGSRRIFTPQFKLQVLESYRSDSDCKGNQRATARKYNIHRRQIQKWLQCESNLRSSVANINQNSVKHQFHNISHHHHQQQHQQQHSSAHVQSAQRLTLPIASRSGANNNGYSHHHHHNHPQVPLDAAHPTLAFNSLNVPSMPARVASSNTTSTQGVLAANLAAAVAVAIASSSPPSTSTTGMSPLRPTAIGGAAGGSVSNNSVSTLSSSMLHSHHHHHHHYSLSRYARSPVAAPVPVSVPMLPHHIAQPQQPHALHQQHYSYHNLSPHTHGHVLPTLSHQPSAFLPTACLPVNVLSAVAAASPPVHATTTATAEIQEKEIEENCSDVDVNIKVNLCEQPQETTTNKIKSTIALPETIITTITKPSAAVLMCPNARSYMYESEFKCVYKGAMYVSTERMRDAKCKNVFHPLLYQYAEHETLSTAMISPMDLSLGARRNSHDDFDASTEEPKSSMQKNSINEDNSECHSQHTDDKHNDNNSNTQVVDLTFRKRKVVAACSNSANNSQQPQKVAKRLEDRCNINKTEVDQETSIISMQNQGTDDDEDVDIEVDVDVKLLSSKPVKLFKPYLLDETDDCNLISKSNDNSSLSQSVMDEQREPIIWSNHPAFSYDGSCASSLHSPTFDKHTFPNGSSYFLTSKTSSPQSVLSLTSAPSVSPTNFPLRCPKGSPVSGYESSSSTCSERDDTYGVTDNRPYSLDFQMDTVCDKQLTTLNKPIHIREWLDQDTNADTNTPPLARASIALYA